MVDPPAQPPPLPAQVGALVVRKAIASIGTGPHEHLLRIARRSFARYAGRHGYDLHLHTTPAETSRPAPWSKVPICRTLLDDYDVVLWLDSDLVVCDARRDIAADLAPGRFLGLVEHRTKEGSMPNSGVMLLRGGDDARAFLDQVWDQEDLVQHRWWENAAICRLLGYELEPEVRPGTPTPLLTEGTTFLDPRWNSIPDAPAPGAWIRHYPGYRWQVRAALMARDLVLRRRG